LPRLVALARSPDVATAAAAKALLDKVLAGGRKTVSDAEGISKDQPVDAYLKVHRMPTLYKGTSVADRANKLMLSLRHDRAVQTELKAQATLATVRKLDTELSSRPGSFDPSNDKFRRDNAQLLQRLQETVDQMKRTWPKTRATEEALRLAARYQQVPL
jgi:hypothetical protein